LGNVQPRIDGLAADQIISQQTGRQIFINNGRTTEERTMGYLITFPKVGTYTIGPARVQTAQGEMLSNRIVVKVQDPVEVAQHEKKLVDAAWHCGKEEAYLLEPVPYTLTFYYTDNAVEKVQIQPLDMHD